MSALRPPSVQRQRKRGPIGLAILLVCVWGGFTLATALILGAGAAIAGPTWRVNEVLQRERTWIEQSQAWSATPMLVRSDAALERVKQAVRPAAHSLLSGAAPVRERLRAAWGAVRLATQRGVSTFATLLPLSFLGLALACDGLVERDRRRWGADTESAWIYHFAKSAVLWWVGILLLLRMLAPVALHPHVFLASTALTAGPLWCLAFARYKKHL